MAEQTDEELLAIPIEHAIRFPPLLWERWRDLKNAQWREEHPDYRWGEASKPPLKIKPKPSKSEE